MEILECFKYLEYWDPSQGLDPLQRIDPLRRFDPLNRFEPLPRLTLRYGIADMFHIFQNIQKVFEFPEMPDSCLEPFLLHSEEFLQTSRF